MIVALLAMIVSHSVLARDRHGAAGILAAIMVIVVMGIVT